MSATAFRYVKAIPGFLFVAIALATAPGLHGQAPQQESLVWAPVAKPSNRWVAPNKPHTRLVEVLAAHKNEKSWREPIVRDTLLSADYLQMASGTKTTSPCTASKIGRSPIL